MLELEISYLENMLKNIILTNQDLPTNRRSTVNWPMRRNYIKELGMRNGAEMTTWKMYQNTQQRVKMVVERNHLWVKRFTCGSASEEGNPKKFTFRTGLWGGSSGHRVPAFFFFHSPKKKRPWDLPLFLFRRGNRITKVATLLAALCCRFIFLFYYLLVLLIF